MLLAVELVRSQKVVIRFLNVSISLFWEANLSFLFEIIF